MAEGDPAARRHRCRAPPVYREPEPITVRRARADCHRGCRRVRSRSRPTPPTIFQSRRSSKSWWPPSPCRARRRSRRSFERTGASGRGRASRVDSGGARRRGAGARDRQSRRRARSSRRPAAPRPQLQAECQRDRRPDHDKDSASSRRRKRQQQKSARARKDKLRSTTTDQKTPPPPVPEPPRPASPTGWLVSPQRAAQFEPPVPVPSRPVRPPPPPAAAADSTGTGRRARGSVVRADAGRTPATAGVPVERCSARLYGTSSAPPAGAARTARAAADSARPAAERAGEIEG